MSRQRVWFARDCFLSSDDRMERLGIEFGAEGPFAVEEIMALAKLARARGIVTVEFEQLRRRAFLASADRAKEIVYAADALGALTIRRIDRATGQVTISFPRWTSWQIEEPAGRAAKSGAERQAAYRERKRGPAARDEDVRHAVTDRDVTFRHGDGGTETETETPHSPDPSPEGEGDCPPDPPTGRRKADWRRHEREVAAWAPHVDEPVAGWSECRSTLRDMVEPGPWRIYLDDVHPHRPLAGGGWALGAPPEVTRWVMDRFGRLLSEACDGPVFVVPCPVRSPQGGEAHA